MGLGTRLAALVLMVVTGVATAAVHWPADWSTLSELVQGYAITNKGHGNFKLPLIYLVALLPLVLQGAGKLSVDALLTRGYRRYHCLIHTPVVARLLAIASLKSVVEGKSVSVRLELGWRSNIK